jgi:superfamily I DNA/RNA helicase
MRQIKGLEFDSVIVIEPSDNNYPNDQNGKRLLYTTITRAKKQLLFISSAEPCELLMPAIAQSCIKKIGDEYMVKEVTFGDEDNFN